MYRLKYWQFKIYERGVRCYGNCYGNPNILEGIHIRTSRVEKVEVIWEERTIHVRTHSGSHYVLAFSDIKKSACEKTREVLKSMGVDLDVDACLVEQKKVEDAEKKYVFGVLDAGTLYVRMNGGELLEKAYFKTKAGELLNISVCVHTGMFEDSILVQGCGVCDWRIFPSPFRVQFYEWSDDINAIYLENIGKDFVFEGPDGDVLCEYGKVIVIPKQNIRK